MRAIVLLPTDTLPAMPMTYGAIAVQVAEERLGHGVQLACLRRSAGSAERDNGR